MRPLPVPLLLLLLSPVPGRGGGCPPCPAGVPEPCDSRCPPCARTRSPAEEEPEEPCPPCPPCSHEAAAPLSEGTPAVPGDPPEPPRDIIPLYCALLAALVVGLVAYVAFKCWDTCRKKRQLDKARDGGDPEKLRGDSGGLGGTERAPPEAPALSPEEPAGLERLLELGTAGGDSDSEGTRQGTAGMALPPCDTRDGTATV